MSEGSKIIAQNRRARFDYHIIEKFEAGMVLTGEEIKSLREGEATITESYVRPINGELFLLNAYIKPYSHSGNPDYDPRRPRKLLMNRREIDKLTQQLEAKGLTAVALDIHLKNGRAKLELATARGKAAPDKREAIKDRDVKREIQRKVSR